MKIPYGKQSIDQDDINAVIDVLKSDFLTQGPAVSKFEEEFAKIVGAKYAVAFCNATAALHTGFKVLNKDLTKKVIVTPNTFAASSNCVLYEKGLVEFVDIDLKTFNIDLDQVEKLVSKNPTAYQGIIPVDYACHAIGGGFYNSKKEFIKCGSGKYSDLTVFSFHPVKHIATGEGGMVTTNDEFKYRHLLKLRSHGIERNENLLKEPSHGGWYHEMQELGFNYRMSDINAALGLSQLKKLSANIEKRTLAATKYKEFLKGSKISYQQYDEDKFLNAYHLFVIQSEKRKELYDYLKSQEIYSQVHYLPVYMHPYYQENGFKDIKLINVENYYHKALSLPMFHSLTNEELLFVLDSIKGF
jgi:dTDP-4-amino-4,6-dideoxygalactose transaminase